MAAAAGKGEYFARLKTALRKLNRNQYARFRVSEWRPDTTLSWGTSPAVTAVPTPRVDPDRHLPVPLAHLSIAGEVSLSPYGAAAPSGRCCDPETMADGRFAPCVLGTLMIII